MSKSRSPTPTPNTFVSTNISPSSESTISRPQPHENTPSVQSSEGREQQFTLRPIHPHSLQSPSPEASSRIPPTVRPADSYFGQPMAKRFRGESLQSRGRSGARSSPSSDSQDGMADTEMDTRQTNPTETLPPAVPPKKKRTRTLTTPHQSAVLHALLAQSRFPTTAMREEVGRSIGLSARKVQIWFQNQRQKARRPRSQSDASRRRLPQYGPFPAGPDSSNTGPPTMFPSHGTGIGQANYPFSEGYDDRQPDRSGYSGFRTSESFSSPLEPPPQLLGPGMPGSDLQHDVSQRGYAHSSTSAHFPDPYTFTSGPYPHLRQPTLRSPSPPQMYPLPISRPTTTSRLHDRDFSRTLPPLVFGPSQNRSSFSAPGIHSVYPSFSRQVAAPTYALPRSSSPESTFAHHPPELPLSSRSPIVIPPPYTLQPSPQWDTSTFPRPLRSESSAWSRSVSPGTRDSPGSPVRQRGTITTPELGSGRGEQQPQATHPTSRPRSGRYDPVRATYIYTNPTEPPQSPNQGAADRSDRKDEQENE